MDAPKSSAPRAPVDPKTRLVKLEEKYRRELLPEEERGELYDRLLKLRRRLGR